MKVAVRPTSDFTTGSLLTATSTSIEETWKGLYILQDQSTMPVEPAPYSYALNFAF